MHRSGWAPSTAALCTPHVLHVNTFMLAKLPDDRREGSAGKAGEEVVGREGRHRLPCRNGAAADVGKDRAVREGDERVIRRNRFGLGHVEPRSRDPALGERPDEGIGIDEGTIWRVEGDHEAKNRRIRAALNRFVGR